MELKISKFKIASAAMVWLMFMMLIVMYFVIGLRYTIIHSDGTKENVVLTGFFPGKIVINSLKYFNSTSNTTSIGKDIYGAGLSILVFSAILLVTAVAAWFIPSTKTILRIVMYVYNYLLVLLIFVLSVLVLIEFMKYTNSNGGINGGKITNSTLSIVFLIITGIILPSLTMGTLFDKQLFKIIYRIKY